MAQGYIDCHKCKYSHKLYDFTGKWTGKVFCVKRNGKIRKRFRGECKWHTERSDIDIVRCKECRHWWNEYGDSACMLHSDFTVNADDYCSYGERRE